MKYDLIVIGGGPAGLMAAGQAGEVSDKVLVIEKNNKLGIKLLATGGGRCNITHKINDARELASSYGRNGKFLISAFHKFGPREVIDFFETRRVLTKTEVGDKVFPDDDRSGSVLGALQDYLQQSKVEVMTNAEVQEIVVDDQKIARIILKNKEEVFAKHYIIATGGKSYPETGSTGDAYQWLEKLGHNIVEPKPVLVPIIIQDEFSKELEGLSLNQAVINLYLGKKKVIGIQGGIIFTANGLSGPAVYDLTRHINREQLKDLFIEIDLQPEIDMVDLDKRLQNLFDSTKTFKNSLAGLVQPKMIPVLASLIFIDIDKNVGTISREERKSLVKLLKGFRLKVQSLGDYDKAIVTAGGVDLKEIDPKTMKSKIISNLSIAGELLNLDGPTGGYNLQICWSTGYVAGQNAVSVE